MKFHGRRKEMVYTFAFQSVLIKECLTLSEEKVSLYPVFSSSCSSWVKFNKELNI